MNISYEYSGLAISMLAAGGIVLSALFRLSVAAGEHRRRSARRPVTRTNDQRAHP